MKKCNSYNTMQHIYETSKAIIFCTFVVSVYILSLWTFLKNDNATGVYTQLALLSMTLSVAFK